MVDQTKTIRKRGRQEFSMQDYVIQHAGRVMPGDTQFRQGQGAVLNTDMRQSSQSHVHMIFVARAPGIAISGHRTLH